MLRLSAGLNDKLLQSRLSKLKLAVTDGSFDAPIERAAFTCLRELVELTPKKWTGMLRRSWQIRTPQLGQRIIFNASKVMLYLEEGTGHSTGGYIYPKTKKFLFIPLTARAAIGGWNPGMKYGVDYVLATRVRGIQAMHIVQKFKPRGNQILKAQMKDFLQKAIS